MSWGFAAVAALAFSRWSTLVRSSTAVILLMIAQSAHRLLRRTEELKTEEDTLDLEVDPRRGGV